MLKTTVLAIEKNASISHMFKKICVRFNIIQFVNELAKLSSLIALGHPRNKDQYVSCATIERYILTSCFLVKSRLTR